MDGDAITKVSIFGTEYSLKGPDAEGHARRVAAEVDRRMCEVADRHRITSQLRVAVLALLNMAEELERERRRADEVGMAVADRARELELMLAAAVDGEPAGS